jgi:anaerobic dimethyl sulfoxide reductase subunit B (iron-sulfur subunit)
MRRAGFVLDLGRCVGCSACVLACRLEHGWPADAPRRRVIALNESRHPGGPTYFLSLACHHCERPACVSACPSGALERRADGLVLHREALCLGCRYCEMACPFGAPRFDRARGVMAKCDFCRARVDEGEMPVCVRACPTEALRTMPRSDDAEDQADPAAAETGTAAAETIPGFEDPADCRPSLRFTLPRGIRGRRLNHLLNAMRQMASRGRDAND